MKTLDFVNSNIGEKVVLVAVQDNMFDREVKGFISNKTEFTLIKLTKSGDAYLQLSDGTYRSYPPSWLRLASEVEEYYKRNPDWN
jgi:hypothetical protein